MVLSLTLLKGTGTKITQLYLADAALASGQSRHYLLQRLTGCFATSRADSPPDCKDLPPPQIPPRGLFPLKVVWVNWGNTGTTRSECLQCEVLE